MKVFRPWIAGYLVLCFAWAGVVGLSPWLHQLFEHGGQGAWHTHGGAKALAFDPGDAPVMASIGSQQGHAKEAPRRIFTRNHRPFKLPTAQLAKLIEAAAEWLGNEELPANSKGEGHEHHSLAQLLASGLLDQHMDLPLLPHFLPAGDYRILTPDELLLACIWNAQTPDRGPPMSMS